MRVFFPALYDVWMDLDLDLSSVDRNHQDAHEREETTPSPSSVVPLASSSSLSSSREKFRPGNFVGSDRRSSIDKIAHPRARAL